MAKSPAKRSARALREQGARYVVTAQGQPVGVLLTLEDYARFLDLLDDEAEPAEALKVAVQEDFRAEHRQVLEMAQGDRLGPRRVHGA